MKYTKHEYITALMWNYGFTKREAERCYKDHINKDNLNECVSGFKRNAKEVFYND